MIKLRLVLTLLLFSIFSKSFAQPGALDASFAGKGIQTYSFKQNASSETPTATVTDGNGNIYITGAETTSFTLPFIAKLLPGGKPDLTFANKGKKILSDIDPNYTFYPKAMALHIDGGIVLAGCIYDNGTYTSPCIVKLSADGTVQNLGGKGFYVSYIQSSPNATFTGVHVLPNGDIVATGDGGDAADFIACKLNQNGDPSNFTAYGLDVLTISTDTPADATCSFLKDSLIYMAGNTGTQIQVAAFNPLTGNASTLFSQSTLPVSGNTTDNFCTSIQVNASNHVILGGYGTNNTTSNHDFLIYQLMPDGSFDFCKNYSLPDVSESYSMTLDAGGKIVLGGFLKDSFKKNNWVILRTDASGKLDGGFGMGGYQTFTSLHSSSAGYGVNCLLRQPDGSYLLTGQSSLTSDDIIVKRLTTTGSPVTAFGNNSEYRLWLADAESYITDITVRSDGEFFVSGTYVDPTNGTKVSVLALLKKDGTFDASFGGTGGADPGTLNISTLAPLAIRSNLELSAIQIQPADNKIILAGSYSRSGAADAFILRLSPAGALETAFNSGLGYNVFNSDSTYIHDLAVQSDNKLLVYGYSHGSLTLMRFMNDGTLDGGFATNGIYTHPFSRNTSSILADEKVELRIQNDQKIVCVGTSYVTSNDFLVFRLTTAGLLDTQFGKNNDGIASVDLQGNNDRAYALAIKPDGKIVAGGWSQWDGITSYGLIQLTGTGLLDTTFGAQKTGILIINKNYQGHTISHLEVENSNAILASGIAQYFGAPPVQYFSVMRLTASGVLDNTFTDKGHTVYGKGYGKNGIISGSNYYLVGATNYFTQNSSYTGSAEIIKIKLGTGPVIKSTNLQLTDLQKTYGDAPFILQPSTNSSAAVQYSITHGTCATVDAATGLVTIKCVPSSPDEYVGIQAYQPAVLGFTEAEANITLNIAKAIPKIIFPTQGGLIDSTIVLKAIAKEVSNGMQFSVLQDPDFVLEDLGGGNMTILKEGCAIVQVTVYPTANYLLGTATASVCGYSTPLPPLTYDDKVEVTYAVDVKTTINVLANDEGRTGTIDPKSVDLDPSTPDVADTVFISSAYGKFSVDTLGNVTYTPFEGFVGKGGITYTVRDSYGLLSDAATIIVVQKADKIPALKATELFTPNKDGLNDAFVIGWVDLKKENKLKVFDRNGQELFTKTNYRNDWYGELPNGKEAENGIYYYVFQEGTSGDQRELKGAVELRR